jgi:hypothetical protein
MYWIGLNWVNWKQLDWNGINWTGWLEEKQLGLKWSYINSQLVIGIFLPSLTFDFFQFNSIRALNFELSFNLIP